MNETTNGRLAKGAFRIDEFQNPSKEIAYRVNGWTPQGERVRKNFKTHAEAMAEKQRLEVAAANIETAGQTVFTRLTAAQVNLCERALGRLNNDSDLLPAVEYWLKHGKANSEQKTERLFKAFEDFKAWMDTGACDLRKLSKSNLKRRVNGFVCATANMPLSDVTPETIEAYLAGRSEISAKSKDNDRRAVSRFFSWCMERPRRWLTMNPCSAISISMGENSPPATLTLYECKKLLREAAAHKGGQLAPYVAVCLFAGLRPFEVSRLQWSAVNLQDREIRLEGIQTKTGAPRVVSICDTLAKWLKAYKDVPFFPANWRRDFDVIKAAAGYRGRGENLKPWPVDVMRHTAISHYFRKTGSYGQTAEQFGNSEAIIKRHYQGRVSSEETAKFYALKPAK